MRTLRRAAFWVALASAGVAVALGLRPISTREILAAYVLALTAIALVALAALARDDELTPPSAFEHALAPRRIDVVRPAELVRMERELTLGSANVAHLHSRLLPLLREAAAARLAAHERIDLERRPGAARALLGDEAWEWLRPDRELPADRSGAGLPLRRIATILDAVERL